MTAAAGAGGLAVTFDAGQTLVELDTALLAERLAERGPRPEVAALERAQPAAWRRFERVAGAVGHQTGWQTPWQVFMAALLTGGAGLAAPLAEQLAAWLWSEQPVRNLWRRPVAGMFELVADLVAAGVPVGVVSNSEGRLAELLDEIGHRHWFGVIADSGRLGVAKPEPGIFEHAAGALGVAVTDLIHVGDSRAADVDGARAVGARAVWFGPAAAPIDDAKVATATDAGAVRAALRRWNVPVCDRPACHSQPGHR